MVTRVSMLYNACINTLHLTTSSTVLFNHCRRLMLAGSHAAADVASADSYSLLVSCARWAATTPLIEVT